MKTSDLENMAVFDILNKIDFPESFINELREWAKDKTPVYNDFFIESLPIDYGASIEVPIKTKIKKKKRIKSFQKGDKN